MKKWLIPLIILAVLLSSSAAWATEVTAAGDLCGSNCNKTANLATGSDLVLPLGDLTYPNGTLQEFRALYDPAWGHLNDIARPVPGNHEYNTTNANGYRQYWGTGNGSLYYSYNFGNWHFVALDTTKWNSTQATWLQNDLAQDNHQCQVVYGHHPRYSSGTHGDQRKMARAWSKMVNFKVEMYLAGHDHIYERVERDGLIQFVSGLGGKSKNRFGSVQTQGSQMRYNSNYGVLKLSLNQNDFS